MQHLRQQSIGDDSLLDKGSFSTHQLGAQASVGYKGLLLRFSVTGNDEDADLRSPYGSYVGYTGSTVQDFNRAGELTWRPSVSYDFARLGLEGVKANAAYARASGAVDENTGAEIGDFQETDITIDYRPDIKALDGLWVRFRTAFIEEENADNYEEYRLIVNYDFTILGEPASQLL